MAYEPKTWTCGETITSESLNNIERGVAEIMSGYVPTDWQCGDVITAEKLNKIEQGIANASGGECEFSTAELTIVNTSADEWFETNEIAVASEEFEGLVTSLEVEPQGQAVFKVPLYNGQAFFDRIRFLVSGDNVHVFVSGSSPLKSLMITGDGTLTVSGGGDN